MEDIFDKYIEISPEFMRQNGIDPEIAKSIFDSTKKVSVEEHNALVNEINETVKTFLENKKFEKENVKISLDNKETNASKASVTLTSKETYQLLINVLEKLKNNQYLISMFGNIEGMDKISDNQIEQFKDDMEYVNEDSTFEFAVYTTGLLNKLVKVEIKILNNSMNKNYGISYTIHNEADSQITVFEEEEDTNKINNNMTLNINKNGNTTIFECMIEKYDDLKMTAIHTKKSDKEGNITLGVTIPSEYMNNQCEDVKANLNCDYITDYEANISKSNIQKAVKIENLTEQDRQKIQSNYEASKLYKAVEKIISTIL